MFKESEMEITKENVINALDELPGERLGEVLEFVMLLKHHKQGEPKDSRTLVLKAIPAGQLKDLIGLVSWGGDALADTERLYEV